MTSTVKGFRFSSSTQTCIDTSQMYIACYVCTQTLAGIYIHYVLYLSLYEGSSCLYGCFVSQCPGFITQHLQMELLVCVGVSDNHQAVYDIHYTLNAEHRVVKITNRKRQKEIRHTISEWNKT